MPDFKVSRDAADAIEADVLAIPWFEDAGAGPGAKEVERALALNDLVAQSPLMSKEFSGKLGEVIAAPTLGSLPAKQVLLVGLGKRADAKADVARKAGAVVARKVGGARVVATTVPQAIKGGADAAAGAFAEGFLLGSYRYERYKATQNGKPNRVESVALVAAKGWDTRKVNAALERAAVTANATIVARDLVNTPSGDKSPEMLAELARSLAKGTALKVKVFDEKELAKRGFGGILGVGRGAPSRPPRLIELRYDPPAKPKKTIAFVGKGITFDSGGINIKPSAGLDWMKMDLGGAAAVLGAMTAIAALKPKVAVRGYLAAAENLPDGEAIRPGDVLRHYGGKTTEVGNTDAEGRLVMADAIVYAREQGADVVVDVATLTGAAIHAVGRKIFAVIGNDKGEVRKVLAAAGQAGEPAWELPLFMGYRAAMESDIADLRNIASIDVGAGTVTAALFLNEFTDGTPWVHLDIAAAAKADSDDFERPKGGTGVAARTLVEYAMAQG